MYDQFANSPTTVSGTTVTFDFPNWQATPFMYLRVLCCPDEPPGVFSSSTSSGTSSIGSNTWLSYVCNRGVNSGSMMVRGITSSGGTTTVRGDSQATGVCLNQFGVAQSSTSTRLPRPRGAGLH